MQLKNLIKRSFDIVLSLFLIICFWWFFLIIFFSLQLFSGSPVLFTQKRIGQFGKIFTLYKFRSMKQNTDNMATHNLVGTEVTKIGRILRLLKIDETPQIFNVLLGDMSFVGPRPSLPSQKELILLRKII